MASLLELLAHDGFHHDKHHKPKEPNLPTDPNEPSLPSISLCFDSKNADLRGQSLRSNVSSSIEFGDRPNGVDSYRTNASSFGSAHSAYSADAHARQFDDAFRQKSTSSFRSDALDLELEVEPTANEAASLAVIAVLSGYAGRFLRDSEFRRRARDKCGACLASARHGAAHAVLTNLQLGMENIERLAADGLPGSSNESKIKSLRNSIRLLSVVASLSSPKSRDGYTCGVPNTHLSACAQLYLAIVYKIERNDAVSARHLLQVFCDAPYLARKNLLPDLWEHFLLPHLLHLKVWYNKEVELVTGWDAEERKQRMKGLNRVYNDQMDVGTAKFAMYYKEWLKCGGTAPDAPSVALPARPCRVESWGKHPVSVSSPVSDNKGLYQVVFGLPLEQEVTGDGVFIDHSKMADEKENDVKNGGLNLEDYVHSGIGFHQRRSNNKQAQAIPDAVPPPRRSLSFRLLSCQTEPNKGTIRPIQLSKIESTAVATEPDCNPPVIDLSRALALISNSDSLPDCEAAVHVVAKAWLQQCGDSAVEAALSTSSVIEGLLDVTLTSKDNKVLELAISLVAELVVKNEVNGQVILNADPQLEIFLRLLRSTDLFLKAAVLLYLLKPKAKQMLSLDWIELVLRVFEHGDQPQTLFTVQFSPRLAAFYFLEQLLTGFDVDRNMENAKQMVVLGGLGLLIRRLEMGDAREKKSVIVLLATCVRADGNCRNYLASNVKKASIIKLLAGNQLKSDGTALFLLTEMVSLNRRTQITKVLTGLKNDGLLNTMHILLVYLQQAPIEQRPLAAAMLLQLDLLGDPLKYSIYREEALDAIVAALERNLHNKRVQEQCSRALLLLAGRFSSEGETKTEAWLLKRAGLDDYAADIFNSKEMLAHEFVRQEEEDKATDVWLRKLAIVLHKSGKKRFLVSLSNCIADGIPSLARSCLVTVAWMSNSLCTLKTASNLQSLACSILAPRLLESLNYDRALEERVLASLSLFNYVRDSECLSKLFPLDKETIGLLQDLAQVTWTAKELLFACNIKI